MKVFIRAFFVFSLFLTFSCNNRPSEKEINAYLDSVAAQENLVLQRLNDLIDAYDNYSNNTAEMEKAYNAVNEQLEKSEKAINNLQSFKDDKILRASALEFIQSIKSLMENEHKRILELYQLPADKFQKKEEQEMEQLRDQSDKKSEEIMTTAEQAFDKFTKQYSK